MRRAVAVAAVTALCLAVAAVGYAATFTLTATKLGGAAVGTPIMFPDSVTTANVNNAVGKIQQNDTITFVWSSVIDETTLCSGWSNSLSTHTTNISWTVQNNTGATGNDLLVPAATPTCTSGLHVGAVDLGSAGYVTTNTTMSNDPTTVTVGPTTTSLKMTVAPKPTVGTVSNGTAAVWTPDTAVTDLSGRNCGANLAKTSATNQF